MIPQYILDQVVCYFTNSKKNVSQFANTYSVFVWELQADKDQ